MKIQATHDEIVKLVRACAKGDCGECAMVDFCFATDDSPKKIEDFCEMIQPFDLAEALRNVK